MLRKPVLLGAFALLAACPALGTVGATDKVTAGASVVRSTMVVQGKRFFPLMMIDQCDDASAAHARTLGINLILDESCEASSPTAQLDALSGGQIGVLPIDNQNGSGSQLAGWTYPDEPENNGWTVAKLAQAYHFAPGTNDGLISFVTTTSAFFRQAPFGDPHVPLSETAGIAHLADVAGFDLYPLNHCLSDLAPIYEAQRTFVSLVGAMPTFQWIETGPLKPGYCGGFAMSPAQLNAEAWLAVVGGARGIGFFTTTIAPASNFNVSPPVQHAIARFTALARAVSGGLLGNDVPATADSSGIKVLGRIADGGARYVFAVNALTTPVRAKLTSHGLANGRVRVFGEKRTVPVSGQRFSDTFAPLAVHVYVQSAS